MTMFKQMLSVAIVMAALCGVTAAQYVKDPIISPYVRHPIGSPRQQSADAQAIIQAGIVYKMGGPQAVARVKFGLLDASMAQLLSDQGCHANDRNLSILDAVVFNEKYGKGLICPAGVDAARLLETLKPHLISSVTTGFDGTAPFDLVPAGTYWIFGWANTRKGFAVWDVKIDLRPGRWTFILDQDNAATSF